MAIADTIKDDMKTAMRAKEKERLATIRLILARFKQFEVDEGSTVDDEAAIVMLDKMIKQRRDSIKQYKEAGREELAQKEQDEIEVIQHYLPQPLNDEEVDALIDAAITETGAESMKDMGKVVALLKPQLLGRADMGSISGKIKAKLS